MNKRIKYICYYDKQDAKIKRNYVLAATNKLDYIFKALNAKGIGVDIVSCSGCIETKWVYSRKKKIVDGLNILHLFASWGCYDNAFFRVLDRWFLHLQFLIWILLHVKKDEEIVVYHSLGYVNLLLLAKKIKRFRIIGEIEEIYQDVSSYPISKCRAEYAFIEKCEKYIFPTSLLNDKLNNKGKPFLLIHGTYQVEPDRGGYFDDGKIHVVYAGTFDPNKGAAAAAAAAAAFLPENYHLHILGFGNKRDTEAILKVIKDTTRIAPCTLTYDGLLKGEEYIRFIQKCQIGLSTQNPDAAFNATSFPSKILSYMANGLRVVSIRIKAIEESSVGQEISYYDCQTPEEIAKAIVRVDLSESYDSRETIEDLNRSFSSQLSLFLYS